MTVTDPMVAPSPKWRVLVCLACRNDFLSLTSRLRDGRGKYCSKKCRDKGLEIVSNLKTDADRKTEFNKHWMTNSANGCWEAKSALSQGYGRFHFQRKTMRSHRAAWEIYCGPIPARMIVCHKCDNRRCCNPDHLFLGTQSDNLSDMHKKGRWVSKSPARGEHHFRSTLTEEVVKAIRCLAAEGFTQIAISRIIQADRETVRKVITNQTWRHVS